MERNVLQYILTNMQVFSIHKNWFAFSKTSLHSVWIFRTVKSYVQKNYSASFESRFSAFFVNGQGFHECHRKPLSQFHSWHSS